MSIAQSVKHQDRLLTINIKDGEIKNALPGVHVTPCFLDPVNGKWIIYARFDAGVVMPLPHRCCTFLHNCWFMALC